jgi:hypothetical protein
MEEVLVTKGYLAPFMFGDLTMKYILAIAAALFVASTAQAETLTCTSIVDVKTQRNVLYKNENLHGGRGRTFLDQDRQLGGTGRLKVAGLNGNVFSCFGLFRCDSPYGCRYYQATCKDTLSNKQFVTKANENGGNYVLVGKGKGKCFKVSASASRYGAVRK